jgi:hypothetical protein
MTSVEIRGSEEEEFDQQVQELALAGHRIIDKMLVVDPTACPPVWGWILYRELTNAEWTTNCNWRRREARAECNGEWQP